MKKTYFYWYLYGVMTSLFFGLLIGYLRYWLGYFVLFQGVLAGITIPILAAKVMGRKEFYKKDHMPWSSFILAAILCLVFLLSQLVGYGLAQPWFDPVGFLSRVVEGQASEEIYAIGMRGAVASKEYNLEISGGFWMLLSSIDFVFMFFCMLISLNTQLEKQSVKVR